MLLDHAGQLGNVTAATGLDFVHGYSPAGTGKRAAPILRDVTLMNAGCTDGSGPYFLLNSGCTVGVKAKIDFGTAAANPTVAPTLAVLKVAGWGCPNSGANPEGLPHDLQRHRGKRRLLHDDDQRIPLMPSDGLGHAIDLNWGTGSGRLAQDGTFPRRSGRSRPTADTSGPVHYVRVDNEPGSSATRSRSACTASASRSASPRACRRTRAAPPLPPVALKVTSKGSNGQAIDCDPSKANLRDELADGCTPQYTINNGTACKPPASTTFRRAPSGTAPSPRPAAPSGRSTTGCSAAPRGSATPRCLHEPDPLGGLERRREDHDSGGHRAERSTAGVGLRDALRRLQRQRHARSSRSPTSPASTSPGAARTAAARAIPARSPAAPILYPTKTGGWIVGHFIKYVDTIRRRRRLALHAISARSAHASSYLRNRRKSSVRMHSKYSFQPPSFDPRRDDRRRRIRGAPGAAGPPALPEPLPEQHQELERTGARARGQPPDPAGNSGGSTWARAAGSRRRRLRRPTSRKARDRSGGAEGPGRRSGHLPRPAAHRGRLHAYRV